MSFTLIFEGDIGTFERNPLKTETAFGIPVAAGRGDAFDKIDDLSEALQRIEQWSEAYPLDIFPAPDLKKAAEVLKANGITLDSISAHVARHVVEGVGKIASAALTTSQRAEK